FGDGRLTHLPGGVEEYLARSPAPATERPGRPLAGDTRAAKKELARLERQVAKLEERAVRLHEALAMHATDYEKVTALDAAVLAVCAVIGRNLDFLVNTLGGLVFMAVGMLMLGLLQTDANFLGFSMTNCVVSLVLGTIVFTAGLYGRTGSASSGAHRSI